MVRELHEEQEMCRESVPAQGIAKRTIACLMAAESSPRCCAKSRTSYLAIRTNQTAWPLLRAL